MTSATLVLHPHLKRPTGQARSPQARLDEAEGLAHAINLNVVLKLTVPIASATPATLLGKGKVEELAALIKENAIQLVIMDGALTPIQQRNLEKAWECKVIDRTALILEIFGARARTNEGKLQVELAALNYQKTRLVRSWTHLERQRGGFGFLGGPGESQIEIDRRLIRDRISRLKTDLSQVTRTRELHRKKRRQRPYPVIALVGYTNAGKSTLFNRLTGADVLAMDKLFATLDPTMRASALPSGTTVIFSDTVGFVSDLPTELIAAFRATLEEVLEADLLLHVRDTSHPDTEAQKADVEAVLRKLFGADALPENVSEVLNKVDLLPPEARRELLGYTKGDPRLRGDDGPLGLGGDDGLLEHVIPAAERGSPFPPPPRNAFPVSALTGQGVPELMAALDARVAAAFFTRAVFTLPPDSGKALAWLHRNGNILSEAEEEATLTVVAMLAPENIHRFEKLFSISAHP